MLIILIKIKSHLSNLVYNESLKNQAVNWHVVILEIRRRILFFCIKSSNNMVLNFVFSVHFNLSILFMYKELLNSKKEEVKGKILFLPRLVSNKVRFVLYNVEQKSSAFELRYQNF